MQRPWEAENLTIRLDTWNADAYYNRGVAYGSLVQPKRAIIDFDEPIRLDFQLALTNCNRSRAYTLLERI